MKTQEKYKEMGFIQLSDKKVQDKHGDVYYPKKSKRPQQAIKLFCRECVGADRRKPATAEGYEMVSACGDPMCPLFDFRRGKNPHVGQNMTDEQKKALAVRLALAREA